MADVNIQDSTGARISVSNPLPVKIEDVTLEADITGLKKSLDFGTATSVAAIGAFTLADTAKGWEVNIWSNYLVRITAGAGIGQVRTIASNTATVLTVYSAWGTALSIASKYEIFEGQTTPITNTWIQLTAPGNSAGLATPGLTRHSVWCTVAAINTSLVLRVEGSLDGTNWANLDASNTDFTVTGNGTYGFTFEGLLAHIRVVFVSELGGTAATVDAKYLGM